MQNTGPDLFSCQRTMAKTVHVAVAVIINHKDEVCISLRHKNAHQGGLWEFPGGKIEAGESAEQALVRELKEELALEIVHTRALIKITHDYDDKRVCLHVHKVLSFHGTAKGMEGQQVKWLPIAELSSHVFPVANRAIINSLLLPDKYLITGKFTGPDDFTDRLSNALNKGIKLVQLRLKENSVQDSQQAQGIIESAANLCGRKKAMLMLNLPARLYKEMDLTSISFAGFHLDSRSLNTPSFSDVSEVAPTVQSNGRYLLSASCHNSEELILALQLKADFVVLSPVQKTASHPEMEVMGWKQFAQLTENLSIPVYALGGVAEDDLDTAKLTGAQGIAAISAFWE